ncbi:MAG: hypothetical protein BWY93_01390 [Euryarchaeota archaeon ADurb.BinA087]|nr:MAG: hypothetical protein BWY93_01390 [Euryarchaeota archaeon ADurb.BinA087]
MYTSRGNGVYRGKTFGCERGWGGGNIEFGQWYCRFQEVLGYIPLGISTIPLDGEIAFSFKA